jgi:uncharacterized protein YndB with AHSA1/START domain/DNA-binding transcriptional ArsR family regulator
MDIFTALAEPTRRTIVEMLARSGPLSATEIYEKFPVSPPAISQHLKVLREAKLVHMEKRAQQRMYQLNPDALFELEGWASHMTQLWHQRFDALDRVLEAEKKNIAQNDMERRSTMAHQNTKRKEVTITRLFDAPRELVFKAWTDPKQLAQWWGPHGFTNPVCELDVRPGGTLLIDMRGPDGVVYPNKGVFHEIVEPERLVFTTSSFEDAEGNLQLEVLNTVTFAELGGKTKLTLQAVVVKSTSPVDAALTGMEEGWNQSLDRLAKHLG